MNKRKLIISITGLLILVGGFFAFRVLSSSNTNEAPKKSSKKTKAVVRTKKVNSEQVKSELEITGRVIAQDKIELFAEVTGISYYGARPFKTGNTFRKGEVLLKIDDAEFVRTLAAAKSQFSSLLAQVMPDLKLDYPEAYPKWKEYLVNFEIEGSIRPLPEIENEQLKFFLTGRSILADYYNILQSEERLKKYVIRAPFTGTLTESTIDRGTLVRTGQQLGEFIKGGTFELEASVAYDKLKFLKQGTQITFSDVKGSNTFKGTLVRTNDKIDPNTQLVQVFFQLKDSNLKSGLYLKGDLETVTYEDAFELPIQSLVDNAFILTVEEGVAKKTPIDVKVQNAETFIATGIPNGTKVIIDKKNSAFAGTEVIEM